ncbi:MAG TPA: Ca2+-dependent phosphoinositide-specific phospholipase C [Polyangiaceae bacterium]|nr:Ca2+-dependent phosphoinositide-specific phospholipase C [Polyangiaceae bacterium]
MTLHVWLGLDLLWRGLTSTLVQRGLRVGMRTLYAAAALLSAFGVSTAAPAAELRFDAIQQRFIHNAFGNILDGRKDEQLLDQLVHHRVRALELDLHPDHPCGSGFSSQPEWFIYHDCLDTQSNVARLSEALHYLRAFHEAQPRHEVVTIDLELGSLKAGKGNISAFDDPNVRTPETLDALIRAALGSSLFTPRDLLTNNGQDPVSGSLHAAVSPRTAQGPSGWPTTDELRGKFIFLIHGHDDDLNRYFGPNGQTANQRVAFMIDEGLWDQMPATSLAERFPHLVFHSELHFHAAATRLRSELPGHILRSKQIDDGNQGHTSDAARQANVEAAQRSGVHFVFMDRVHVPDHPFIRTHNDSLYPFGASVLKADGTFPVGAEAWQHPAVVGKAEPGSMLVMGDKSGGDLDGSADRFIFAPDTHEAGLAPDADDVWTAEIASTSNKSVHPHGKGFIMARQSLDPGSPYCAVGRTADRYGLRLQGRWHSGEGTQVYEFRSGDIYRENYHFVRLEILPQGDGSTLCRAYGAASAYDDSWEQIGPDVYTEGRLPMRGVATASNSGYNADNVRSYSAGVYSLFEFVDLRRGRGGATLSAVDLGGLQALGIGTAEAAYVLKLDGDPRLSLARNYSFGETMQVHFANLPGNARDWITYVPDGAASRTEEHWKYTGGAVTGSLELLAPPAGRYRLRAYRDDGEELIVESPAFDVAPTPASLAAAHPSYFPGMTITAQFSALPGHDTDWIALVPQGATVTANSSWQYTSGVTTGSIDFLGLFPPGQYRLQAFVQDTQTLLLESAPFQVLPSPALVSPTRSSFAANDTISATFASFPGNDRDWIALIPGCSADTPAQAWQYTGGASAGTATFDGPFPPGTYCFRAFANDSFFKLTESAPFSLAP